MSGFYKERLWYDLIGFLFPDKFRFLDADKEMMKRKLFKLWIVFLITVLIGCGSLQPAVTATGAEIYALVKNSDQKWLLTVYDLITPENAKDAIVLLKDNGKVRFNLAWPRYGGFVPESIGSIKELSGKLDVSRIGGDGGHSMSYGRNRDGTYPDASQRSLPKSAATVKTGAFDADKYKTVVDTIAENEEDRLSALIDMGYDRKIAERFVSEFDAWPKRDEIAGPDNIGDGVRASGHTVESRYGYYGRTAPWTIGSLTLKGGSGQLDTVFSWGLLCDSGLITDTGTAEIR